MGTSTNGTKELKKIFGGHTYFDTPKPTSLLKKLITLANTSKDSIVLDFFSGSATTAHAVMQLNAEDGGKRKFIMVQLIEPCSETSEAYKAGYKNICEIGKERIRRAAAKIRKENPDGAKEQDLGFRVLKLDSSNMKDVYYSPSETIQKNLSQLIDNIKEDRSCEDLLFQAMLECDILLSSPIEEIKIAQYKVYKTDGLIACFDKKLDSDAITQIAKMMPNYFVMRDSSIENDSIATNIEQIFKTYSPQTKRRII